MKYLIKTKNPLTHLLEITLSVVTKNEKSLNLKLPIWRPGRYEASNYSKNIQKIEAFSKPGERLTIEKLNPSHWSIDCSETDQVEIKYNYYAHQMDAGNSFVDAQVVYINFINCLLYSEDRMDLPHEVLLDIPKDYKIACSLIEYERKLIAESYYELVDSPMIASANLAHHTYDYRDYKFHIWIQGGHDVNMETLVGQFKKLTKTQIHVMGDFPVPEYHFLFHILPYKHYHGVEHGASTVITLGPAEEVTKKPLYNELLGVSSHELFHTWNILKIRPKELMPYDFGEPAIFPTGFVAEGFTTYYGDLFLKRSGVFTIDEYLKELEKLFTRHFLNFGRLNNSVYDSSIDLWFDGYQPSAPHKKSSIYVEGAVISLLLDLQIRLASKHKRSLDNVMRILWERFGKTGNSYSYDDVVWACEKVYSGSLSDFFNSFVKGTKDTKALLIELLEKFGLELSFKNRPNVLESTLGVLLLKKEDGYSIVSIEPGAMGEQYFSIQDEVKSINETSVAAWLEAGEYGGTLNFQVIRKHQNVKIELTLDLEKSYLRVPEIKVFKESTPLKQWFGINLNIEL